MAYVIYKGEKYEIKQGVLNLNSKEISDITEIEKLNELTQLEILFLSGNQITEIKGLENLSNLKKLYLISNQISEIKGLDNFENLKELYLHHNQISEIKGLDNLINLQILFLTGNKIAEIKGLDNLPNLQILYFTDNKITEIKGVDNLKNLKDLYLNNNQISYIKGLDNLINLQNLDLTNNKIKDIKGLERVINLKRINLAANNISEIKGLENLKKLETLNLSHNKITAIKGLEELFLLKVLYLTDNKINTIENLENQVNLEILYFLNNQITEIKGLENLSNLNILNVASNQISEIKGLERLSNLKELVLSNNNISELMGLENLINLMRLEIDPFNLKGIDEFMVRSFVDAQKVVEYCNKKKKEYKVKPINDYNENVDYNENIKNYKNQLRNFNDSALINIGTNKEDEEIKKKQNIAFYNLPPRKINLIKKRMDLKKITLNLIQIHSLKGINPPYDEKLVFFTFLVKHFWDNNELENNHVLIYKDYESIISKKIEEMLILSYKINPNKPHVIVFPENSIPYEKITYLEDFSRKNNTIIIGGLEHKKDNIFYINKSIIIDNGKIGYQVKQTPVRIYESNKTTFIQENIKCKKIPRINIFKTKIGNIAIFVCKDFLRLNNIIEEWAWKNEVDLIIIPSLTSKVLPFHSKLINIINYTKYKDLTIVFTNIGEYGGSELFSIDTISNIERSFKENRRDNIGETIVVREHEIKEKISKMDEIGWSDEISTKHDYSFGEVFIDGGLVDIKFNCVHCGHELYIDSVIIPRPYIFADTISGSRTWGETEEIYCECGLEYEVVADSSYADWDLDFESENVPDTFKYRTTNFADVLPNENF